MRQSASIGGHRTGSSPLTGNSPGPSLSSWAFVSRVQQTVAIAGLTLLMAPAQHRELFERRDDKGNYNDIPEVIASLIDWVDPDEELANMNADGRFVQGGGAGEDSRFGGFDVE